MHKKTLPTVVLGLVGAASIALITSVNVPQAAGTNNPLCHWTEGNGYVLLHLSLPGRLNHLQNHEKDYIPENNSCEQTDTTVEKETTTTTTVEETTTTVTVPEETTTTVTPLIPPAPETSVPPVTVPTQKVQVTLPATR